MYFNHYKRNQSTLHKLPEIIRKEQIMGNVFIHQDADVHHSAIIGPNVTIGSKAKIHAGCRIANSIILEGVEIQAHTICLFSLVGWNSKIGPWCRLEGSMTTNANTANEGRRFDVTVVGDGSIVHPEVMIRDCLIMPERNIKKNCTNHIVF